MRFILNARGQGVQRRVHCPIDSKIHMSNGKSREDRVGDVQKNRIQHSQDNVAISQELGHCILQVCTILSHSRQDEQKPEQQEQKQE